MTVAVVKKPGAIRMEVKETMNKRVLGVEIGGTKLQLAVGRAGEEPDVFRRGAADAAGGAAAILDWFEREIPSLLAEAGPVDAIGAGFGGPVDSASGRALCSFQVGGWNGIALKDWFEQRFEKPTVVSNDSNAAGWAEYRLGAGRGTRHFMYSNIGSGIGGAIVIDGRLHNGQGYGAAEVGHTYVPAFERGSGPAADKLENLCSGWSIERRLHAMTDLPARTPLYRLCGGDVARLTCAMLGEAARQGDPLALEEIGRVASRVGLALANAITLFHPEKVALGGGVPLMGDVLLEPVRTQAERYVFEPYRGHYEIVPCALGEAVVLLGAMLLAAAEV